MSDNKLKSKLIEWKENDWNIPKEVNKYQLSLELMENLKSTDPVLRDKLSYSFLWTIISEKKLSQSEARNLLKLALSQEHLFHKLGTKEDDSVFNRAFSVLIIAELIEYHNNMLVKDGQAILSKTEIVQAFNKVLEYLNKERDVRGYVNEKGWADSVCHTGDALASLAQCVELDKEHMIDILKGIKEKVSISYYAYNNEEDERLTTAIMKIINRDDIKDEDIIEWIRSFNHIEQPKNYPNYIYFRQNVKNFLRSVYFRFKVKGVNSEILNEIEKVLNKINERYNQYN
ncbi:DUF2785 domain-containing protein [Oceanirhabdus seepicola]|uniref:DUF2785 domain-containing protein n=1 Tax=Oceanirhabdus seepicola TaxID=2828781 RepID=A0A9J6P5S8_9CLOT|nr:DUF2785 domain-containing protein [Oceanirhabdus seepicola]MCM1992170.1 DUF2785 domain-containing protein [Oceanirhabdus seepicola]